ncbi:MAG: hypothetical protein NW224_23395 [Leptolyngbyaceae cyanobacterium bins.302]|nr:hypothetical protein [Leptolyngbyaceae cyanobacterium bins.302]
MNSSTSDFSESNRSFQKEPSLELGDVPVVQERFQALLKHRLQSEIQKNPPLFPWETELVDYGTEPEAVVEPGVLIDAVPRSRIGVPGWLRQVKNLSLPVPAQIPEPVLATLFQRCQEAVQSSLQEGAKLVRAVEELFPGQDEALNYLAGNVMMAPARSPKATTAEPPIQYEEVVPDQQMVLSLLAAREILNTLSLKVSASEPVVDRSWQTDAGLLSLHLEYVQTSVPSVRIHAILPTAGALAVRNGELRTTAQRTTAGRLSAELFEPQPNHVYTVEFYLAEIEQPLTFALRVS